MTVIVICVSDSDLLFVTVIVICDSDSDTAIRNSDMRMDIIMAHNGRRDYFVFECIWNLCN